jgi:adenine-specific DNA-methyltransferase
MFDRVGQRETVKSALASFSGGQPKAAARELLKALGYSSEKSIRLDGSVSQFLSKVDREGKLSANERAQTHRWESADFVIQLTNDELPMLAQGQLVLQMGETDYHRSIIESFVFLTIGLADREWTRTELAEITRAVNRLFPMPAIIFFQYGNKLTLSVIPRRPNKKDSSRDVIEPTRKVALIKDVNLDNPHRAHLDILTDLHIQAGVTAKKAPNNFDDLYKAWTEILSAEELNKRFYDRLSNWYLWAVGTLDNPNIMFPVAREVEEKVGDEERHKLNQIAVIRLLTRLIFVWFIKEKGLVPDALFNTRQVREMLAQDPEKHQDDSTYYKAILQNLFFATLNTQMDGDGRKWRSDQAETGRTPDYLISTLYRYKQAFRDPEQALQTFRKVPFLNGGLFECLDREVSDAELERNPDLKNWISAEGSQKVIRADGFSERKSNLHVPNRIFFAVADQGEEVDEPLNEAYGTKKTGQKVDGLIRIFESYKFTVEENTPFDEEVALDPELLGKVFENLIASYNEDTSTTARKKSGSFYTPRVVVDYMVDEALVGYLKPVLKKPKQPDDRGLQRHKNINEAFDLGPAPGELHLPRENGNGNASGEPPVSSATETRLRALLSYEDTETDFSENEKDRLIARIESIRAIDPACGSGAFPMGLLQKLIHVLKRLDPDNVRWKAALREPLEKQLTFAETSPDIGGKSEQIEALRDQLAKLDRDFSETSNFPDYARKLYVIDKCIHGVDIQPIAVQIAKLRFFISLVVSQKIDETAKNLNITPLPNLETRLVAANALRPIEREKQHELFRNDEIEKTERALAEANERYFGARNRRTKNRAKQLIGELREKLSDLLQEANDLPKETARLIARWDPFDQNASANFFDPEWMFGLTDRFNIVIANPPYVRQEKIGEDKAWLKARHDALKKRQSKNAKFLPEGLYQSFAGMADYLVYFMERGLDLLEPGGSFVFITSNKWYRAAYGENIRRWMGRAAKIHSIIDFGDADVFDAIAYPTIIVAQRRAQILEQPRDEDVLLAWNWPSDMGRKDIPEFPELFRSHAFQVPQKSLDDTKGWQLEPQVKRDLLERILNAGKPLSDLIDGELYRGITTGFNDAFVVDSDQRKHLIQEHSSAKELLVPFLRGKDIERWSSIESGLWLIKIPSSENVKHPWTGRDPQAAERVFENSYPSIYRHLIQFRSELVQRYDQGHFFWELRSCRYWDDFSDPKIISTKVSFAPTFALDKTGSVLSNTAYFFAAGPYPNLILSILNSAVSNFLSQYLFATKQGGFYEVQPDGLKRIPIPTNSKADAFFKAIQLIEFARLDPRFEQLLNGLVYELFFPDELHARSIALFDSCDRAGLGQLEGLEGDALKDRAETLAREIFAPSHEIYRMLFDLRAIDVVRIIEGEE